MAARTAHGIYPDARSDEHGSYIIEALETGRIYRALYVVNRESDQPSRRWVVEVPGHVDSLGIHTPVIGDPPLGCAAACQHHCAALQWKRPLLAMIPSVKPCSWTLVGGCTRQKCGSC